MTEVDSIGPVVLFDGHCNLCNFWANFLMGADTKRKLRFATLQSKAGGLLLQGTGIDPNQLDSLVLVYRDSLDEKSTAVLKILRHVGGVWGVFSVLVLIPRPIRDFVYDFVARSRYRWFGKREQCRIPTVEDRERFLD